MRMSVLIVYTVYPVSSLLNVHTLCPHAAPSLHSWDAPGLTAWGSSACALVRGLPEAGRCYDRFNTLRQHKADSVAGDKFTNEAFVACPIACESASTWTLAPALIGATICPRSRARAPGSAAGLFTVKGGGGCGGGGGGSPSLPSPVPVEMAAKQVERRRSKATHEQNVAYAS
eukprot:365920-Chlamydomonas_euryale.AAC.8